MPFESRGTLESSKAVMNPEQHFKNFLQENQINPETPLLAGVSGGVDSMVLLELCHRFHLKPVVIHVNYQLRGTDSEQDARLVANACRRMNLRYEQIDAGSLMNVEGNTGSVQMKAREIRMGFFAKQMLKHNAKGVLLANHADDQIEGFFIHLKMHNSLAGMSENENFRLRPFLHCFKRELIDFARQNNIAWREDASNSKADYLRNKIRLKLLPELSKFDPEIKQDILKSVTRQKSEKDALNILLEKHLESHREADRGGIRYQKQAFGIFKDPLPILAYILAEFEVSGRFLSQIAANLTNTHSSCFWTNRVQVLIDRSYLSVFQPNAEVLKASETGKPDIHLEEINDDEGIPLIFNRFEAIINPDKLHGELRLRKSEKGDRFYPSGMKGSKLLSDFFTDNKYSRKEKEDQWLLCSGDDIVWVVNQRVDERFRSQKGDVRAWRIQITEG